MPSPPAFSRLGAERPSDVNGAHPSHGTLPVAAAKSRARAVTYASSTVRRIMGLGPYAAALGLPAWVFWRLTRAMIGNPLGYDEQFFMWGGWSVLKGLAPYRDFIEFKPPMTFLSHALALKLFGFENERFRYF